jgi:hypothetical protein
MQRQQFSLLRTWKKYGPFLMPLVMVLTVPRLIPGYFATSVVFSACAVRQPLAIKAGEQFSVEYFHALPNDNSPVRDIAAGQTFCEHTLALSGTAPATPDGTQLRLFNVDEWGGLYLHEPPLTVVNGSWHTTKVGPGGNIREIRFMRVSEATSRTFSEAASRNMWGPYPPPADAETVAAIRLEPVPVCAHLDARKCQKGE